MPSVWTGIEHGPRLINFERSVGYTQVLERGIIEDNGTFWGRCYSPVDVLDLLEHCVDLA
jgi:hypothetical protein